MNKSRTNIKLKNQSVCMVVQACYPEDTRVRREAESLAQRGVSVDIVCLNPGNKSKIEKFGIITVYRISKNFKHDKVIKYISKSILFFTSALIKVSKLILSHKYALIHVHNMPDILVFSTVLAKLRRIPIILDVHDLTVELYREKWGNTKLRFILPVVIMQEKISCWFANHIITVTTECKNLLISRGVSAEKITLILNTPDTRIFGFKNDKNFGVINNNAKLIYHGTVAKRFGLHTIIIAMKYIMENLPGSEFHIYGVYDNSYKIFLQKLVKENDVEKNIFFNERKSQEEIHQIIKTADIGIVPYTNTDYMNLSHSTKLFEYVATGIPVVATELKSLKSIFNDDCISYFKGDDPVKLSKAVLELCSEPEKRSVHVLTAKQALEKISWEIMAERLFNLYCFLKKRSTADAI